MEPAAHGVDDHVLDGGFEQICCTLTCLLDHLFGGELDCASAHLQRARTAGAAAAVDVVGVAEAELDAVVRDSRGVAHDHRPRGVVTLPVRRRTGTHDGATVGRDLDGAVLARTHRIRGLDVRRNADAQLDGIARRPTTRLLGTQLGVTGRLEREVECLLVLAVVVVRTHLGGERELLRAQVVATTHFRGIDAARTCELVDGALDRRCGLGTSRTAVCDRGRGVREHGVRLEADVLDVVHAARHEARHVRKDGGTSRIRTRVLEHVVAVRRDASVARTAHAGALALGTTVPHAEHVLGTGLGPPSGHVEPARHPGAQRILGIHAGLGAEAAADVGRDDAHAALLQTEDTDQSVAHVVRALAAAPMREAAVVPARHACARLHGCGRDALILDGQFDHHVATGEHVGLVLLGEREDGVAAG